MVTGGKIGTRISKMEAIAVHMLCTLKGEYKRTIKSDRYTPSCGRKNYRFIGMVGVRRWESNFGEENRS